VSYEVEYEPKRQTADYLRPATIPVAESRRVVALERRIFRLKHQLREARRRVAIQRRTINRLRQERDLWKTRAMSQTVLYEQSSTRRKAA
jgi:predicted RNase H-like nuclease (RuvC/YqgF family)